MEKNEISIHEVKAYRALLASNGLWVTNSDIANSAKISQRTARAHTLKFAKLGLLEIAEVFPAHRYKWSEKAAKRNSAYVQRLESASEIFGTS